jgi:hypothetical protein
MLSILILERDGYEAHLPVNMPLLNQAFQRRTCNRSGCPLLFSKACNTSTHFSDCCSWNSLRMDLSAFGLRIARWTSAFSKWFGRPGTYCRDFIVPSMQQRYRERPSASWCSALSFPIYLVTLSRACPSSGVVGWVSEFIIVWPCFFLSPSRSPHTI